MIEYIVYSIIFISFLTIAPKGEKIMWKNLTITGKSLIVVISIIATIYTIVPTVRQLHSTTAQQLPKEKIEITPAFEFTQSGQFIVHKKNWFMGSTLPSVPLHTKIKYKEGARLIFVYPEKENADVAVFATDVAYLPDSWKVVAAQ